MYPMIHLKKIENEQIEWAWAVELLGTSKYIIEKKRKLIQFKLFTKIGFYIYKEK